jgi:protoporphyrin/coproporphyrin ferrochelatase
MSEKYDAILFVSFGAPEKPEDVLPFLRNVVRGRGVPDERLMEVAENYQMFGGRSPLNDQNKEIIARLKESLAETNLDLPIYWGNRNWHPFLAEAIREMKRDGTKRALAFVTSSYSSYSGCRQYRENIEAAKIEAEATEIEIHKIRPFYNHPLFVEANAENLSRALEKMTSAEIVFTAHSLPLAMANNCDYVAQLEETCRLVAQKVGRENWKLAFQSRSGAPHVPWLEPDINDYLRSTESKEIIVHPIGFLSDHQEVVYDLDTQAKETAESLGMNYLRSETVGTNPKFIEMIRELILERTENCERRFLGSRGAKEDFCPADCCLFSPRKH